MQKGNLCEFVTNRIWNCTIAFQKKNIRHTYLNHNKASQKSSFLCHLHSMAHFQGGQAQIPSVLMRRIITYLLFSLLPFNFRCGSSRIRSSPIEFFSNFLVFEIWICIEDKSRSKNEHSIPQVYPPDAKCLD